MSVEPLIPVDLYKNNSNEECAQTDANTARWL